MIVQQIGCLCILYITISFTHLLTEEDALKKKMSKEHLSTFKMFDKDRRNNKNFSVGSFLQQKESDPRRRSDTHKKLAEDVLRIYMTAYFIANKARKCF